MGVGDQQRLAKGGFAKVVRGQVTDLYRFQYNPTELSRGAPVEWDFTETPGQYLPAAVFTRFGKQNLSMELYIDGRGSNNTSQTSADFVAYHLSELRQLVSPGPDFTVATAQFIAPPFVKFVFGDQVLNVVVTNVDERQQRFDRNLRPTAVRVSISMSVVSRGIVNDVKHLRSVRSWRYQGV